MPVQVQQTSFARHYGARVAAANEQCQDAPASLGGQQRLPGGVKDGIARLQVMTTGAYKDDKNGPNTKDKPFFRVACVAVYPELNDKGQRVAGIQTSKMVSLCDMPKKGYREATTFEQGYAEMKSMICAFGISPCRENRQTDPTGFKAEAYWFAAMQTLCNPAKPRYIKFSTRVWTPNRPLTWKQGDPEPEPIVIENWEGVATDEEVARMNGRYNPAAGASDSPPDTSNHSESGRVFTGPDGLPVEPTNAQIHSQSPDTQVATYATLDEEVTHLVNIAIDDPEGATEEGQAAHARLEDLAWAGGWSEEQTKNANWEEIGDMALNPSGEPNPEDGGSLDDLITIGSKWKFCKRTKEGTKVRSTNGQEFPPLDVEVATVDTANKTCTLKNTKDGKPITDARTRQAVVAKFEWLE